jgi:hypothetical protein
MWTSDRHPCALVVEGAPGVELRILDADFQLKAEGTVSLRQSLPPGLYMVNWKAGRELQQEIVRLRAGDTRTVVQPAHGAGADQRLQVAAAAEALVQSPSPTSATAHEAEIMVVVDAVETDSASVGVRLFTRDDVAMRSNSSDVEEAQKATEGDVAVRVYHVDPAVYRLQYQTCTGETLDQSVPAIAGRRTVVFLRAVQGRVIVPAGEAVTTLDYEGADPARSVIITIPRGTPLTDAAETRRRARLLLADLAARTTSLGEAFLAEIEEPDADPLVRIYAAAVILQQIEAGASPTLEQTRAPVGLGPAWRWQWTNRALKLLDLGRQEGLPSDVEVATWQGRSGRLRNPGRLDALRTPPMLECCWGWAMKRSVVQPDTIPDSFSFRAATVGAAGASPWLAWRAAAAKGASPDASGPSGKLNAVLKQLAGETLKLVDSTRTGIGSAPFAELSLETRTIAARALRLVPDGPFARILDHGLAQKLAQSVRMPAATLHLRAEQALAEVRQAVGGAEAVGSGATVEPDAASLAPALSRVVRVPDDPHKGRFGGKASAGGFHLEAAFSEEADDWVTVTLAVRSDSAPDGLSVEFFLHDSFSPDHYVETLGEGRAELKIHAWGGFTVGVWIPRSGVELELDLALLPDAPRIVREL